MPNIPLDEDNYGKIVFAARMMNCSPTEVVRRLIEEWSQGITPSDAPSAPVAPPSSGTTLPVHAVYQGVRVEGIFDPGTRTLRITAGPGAGTSHSAPSAAAGAVLKIVKPERNPNTNGWRFWRLDSNGAELQSIRHSAAP
ncbi:hypothetical protein ACFZBU_00380 [Embleya sp. NPDC008237]|uniref:hypothetical protein n=1 Tax=Embleya sp. NPDC008237 TaxID=3363978 RepID=UPI0036E81A21